MIMADLVSRQDIQDAMNEYGVWRYFEMTLGDDALQCAIDSVSIPWNPVSKNPKKDGRYLVTTDGNYVAIKSFAKNLRKIDKYDFDKAEPGWYDYDSDFGYYKYHKVIAWMELPEPYKGADNG